MKEFHILCISLSALLYVYLPAAAQESGDTLEMAVVSANRPPYEFTGLKQLDKDDILAGASVLGAPDVIKALQNLTGVSSGMELLSGLYVHGGDGSDNLFLLDGVPLFQVSHLAGLFSSFNVDVVNSIDFYKSGIPAMYGGKLSSVVDVRTMDGSMKEFGGSVSIGQIDGRISFNGPVIKDRLSFYIALRRSWLEAITIPAIASINSRNKAQTKGNYALLDSNVGLTYVPTDSDKISFRFFIGTDGFDYGKNVEEKFYGKEIYYADNCSVLNLKWGNCAVSSSWRHSFTQKSNIHAMLYYSKGYSNIYDYQKTNNLSDEVVTSETYMEDMSGNVDAAGVKCLYNVLLGHHCLSAGMEYQKNWYAPSRIVENKSGEMVLGQESASYGYSSDQISFFVEDDINKGIFDFKAGIRLDGYFTDKTVYFRPQPRLSVSCKVTSGIIAKASYEAISQYSHLMSSIYLDLPTNLWMPSTKQIRPSDSHQGTLGIYTRTSKQIHLDISGYYRQIKNCLIYAGTGSMFPKINKWEDEFVCGTGRSYGAEIEARFMFEKFTGDLSYTLSWSERKFEELHDDWFRDRFDNRHKLTLAGRYRVSENIDINATWNYHSGNRVTLPEHVICHPEGGTEFLFSEPYNAKIPDYHRLDLSCNFRKKTKRGNERIWNISIYNAYCRMNPIMMLVRKNINDEPVAIAYSLIPIIPSFSYTLNF